MKQGNLRSGILLRLMAFRTLGPRFSIGSGRSVARISVFPAAGDLFCVNFRFRLGAGSALDWPTGLMYIGSWCRSLKILILEPGKPSDGICGDSEDSPNPKGSVSLSESNTNLCR